MERLVLCVVTILIFKIMIQDLQKMEQAIKSNNPKLLICIPDCFHTDKLNKLSTIDKSFWKVHLRNYRKEWARRLDVKKYM